VFACELPAAVHLVFVPVAERATVRTFRVSGYLRVMHESHPFDSTTTCRGSWLLESASAITMAAPEVLSLSLSLEVPSLPMLPAKTDPASPGVRCCECGVDFLILG